MAGQILTADYLRSILHYDPLTGVFTWAAPRPKIRVGDVAGGRDEKGYIRIRIDGKKYRAHRLAWLYVYGEWPPQEIDHKDTIKSNNWIGNLRPANKVQNGQNRKVAHSNNKSGFLGVHKDRYSFVAEIRICGQQKYLGSFPTAEKAYAAYLDAKVKHHAYQTIVQTAPPDRSLD